MRGGTSSNGLVEIKGEASLENLNNIITNPNIIEDTAIAGLKIKEDLVEEELVTWKTLVKNEGWWALLAEAIKSTPKQWRENPERYMALAIELRTFNVTIGDNSPEN